MYIFKELIDQPCDCNFGVLVWSLFLLLQVIGSRYSVGSGRFASGIAGDRTSAPSLLGEIVVCTL
jgi:hypothetical protein